MNDKICNTINNLDLKGSELISLVRFGSHLYGTDTEDSDTDLKGIFLPTKEMLYLNKIPRTISYNTKDSSTGSKNTKDDIDCELFSLHYFIELACKGETVALDIIHVNDKNLLVNSKIWEKIVENKDTFYTKKLKSFVGYARTQAARYSLKGSRIISCEGFSAILSNYDVEVKLQEIFNENKESILNLKHTYFIDGSLETNKIDMIQICGKKFQMTAKCSYVKEIIDKFLKEYGNRAKAAAENKGVDFKAISHALRAAYQTKEILTTKNIVFPLEQATFLRRVKCGELDFTTEVLPVLDELMDEVEILSEKSKFSDNADRKFWDNFIVEILSR